MKISTKLSPKKESLTSSKQRSYTEVIDFLDAHWQENANDTTLTCMKKLDQAFDSPSKKLNVIAITGTNGKSLTMHFASRLLKEEGLTVGAFYAPHILTYNERLTIGNELIPNKNFTELANDVINTAESLGITPNTFEILTMMALLYFEQNNVDVVLLEVSDQDINTAITLCTPKVVAVTRITGNQAVPAINVTEHDIKRELRIVKPSTHVISADQSKINLQIMQDVVEAIGGHWIMPIRKLANLTYPFEQLHGRCAALAERVASIFVNTFLHKDSIIVSGSLLTKKEGQRGRPTLKAKRDSELNPRKTLDQFWKETHNALPGRFQILDKEKPTILLDNARNVDALANVLLGVRLLHYQRPHKGFTLIIASDNNRLDTQELIKQLRYFFKKISGQVIVCATPHTPSDVQAQSWDIEKITNDLKTMKIKARSAQTFKQAFESATKTVDDRNGLVVITGCTSIIAEYWKYKGIKKV